MAPPGFTLVCMATATRRITVDEYFAISEEGDHTELIDGEIVVNDPRARHQFVQLELAIALRHWVGGDSGFGFVSLPINVQLDDHNLYGPDLVWFADSERVDLDATRHGVPDLAVEIRSPGTWRYDIGAKKARYEQHGLPELWLVDTDSRVVLVFRRSRPGAPAFDVSLELTADDRLTSPQLPGFALTLSRLFA